jgi:endonuclease/exonuclease/phosphatase (EEP) superfamily protein YafD
MALCYAPLVLMVWPGRPYVADLLVQPVRYCVLAWLLVALVGAGVGWYRLAMNFALVCVLLMVTMRWFAPASASPQPDARAEGQRISVVAMNAGDVSHNEQSAFIDWVIPLAPDIINLVETPHRLRQAPELRAAYPYCVDRPRKHVTFSRFPVRGIDPWRRSQGKWEHVVARPAIVELDDGRELGWISVYLPSPRTHARWRQALRAGGGEVNAMLASHEMSGRPIVAVGDLNSVPFGRVYRTFARQTKLVPVAHSWTTGGTWPATLPAWLRLPIDHLFTSSHVVCESLEVGPDVNSDHRPIHYVLRIRPADADAPD